MTEGFLSVSGRYVIRRPMFGDAEAILPRVRADDIEEWDASAPGGVDLLPEVIQGSKECWVAALRETPDMPEIIGGAMPTSPYGQVWLLGTDLAERDGLALCVSTKEAMADFHRRWGKVECFTMVENVSHHRWLEWYGYHLVATKPWGWKGRMFHHYRRDEP